MKTSVRLGVSRLAGGVTLVLALAGALGAQTKYPYLDWVYPVAVTRGASTEVEIGASGSLKTAYRVLIEGEDIRGEIQKPTEARKIPDSRAFVRLEVAAGAALGPRDIRLVTEDAITTVARFYVTDLPQTVEKPPHGNLAESQEIPLPAVVCGRVGESVEVDWYRFALSKGERVNFNLIGARLHETIHHVGRFTPHFDAFLSLVDAQGCELAVDDDRWFADPLLSFEASAGGVYHLSVREANYKGHASYTYAILATRGPCPVLTLPLLVPAGRTSAVELVGPGVPEGEKSEVTLPAGAFPSRSRLVRLSSQDVLVGETELPIVLEAEPPAEAANDSLEKAEELSLPAGVAGRLGRADDVDCYAFTAVKGAAYRFEVFARRLWSTLDGELEVLDAKGGSLASADDSRDLANRLTKDPVLRWTAPADGKFVLRLRDLHQRGGREYLYHLECALDQPDFELTMDPELSMIGPGNRSPIYVRAHRRGFDGPIALEVDGLPPGVTAQVPSILPGMTDACVVISAAPEAAKDGSIFRVRGRAKVGGEKELLREARPLVEIYQAQRVVGRTAGAAVTSTSDIAVTAAVSEVVLKPGETKKIPVRIVRAEKYKTGSVTLWGMWRYEGSIFGNSLPPGVSVNEKESSTSLNGDALEGVIALQAAGDAKPCSKVPTVVIGLVPIEFSVFVPFCTPPIPVTVTNQDGTVASAP